MEGPTHRRLYSMPPDAGPPPAPPEPTPRSPLVAALVRHRLVILWAAILLVVTVIDTATVLADARRAGRDMDLPRAILLEGSSHLVLGAMVPGLYWFHRRFPVVPPGRNLLLHAAAWHVKDPQQAEWLEAGMRFVNRWRMPLIFLVSGAAIMLALSRRTPGAFMRDRLQRLLLPLAFGMLVIVPPQDPPHRPAAPAVRPEDARRLAPAAAPIKWTAGFQPARAFRVKISAGWKPAVPGSVP